MNHETFASLIDVCNRVADIRSGLYDLALKMANENEQFEMGKVDAMRYFHDIVMITEDIREECNNLHEIVGNVFDEDMKLLKSI